ncbi:hypothetical protein Tco_0580156 [Tanacetum coccineum]
MNLVAAQQVALENALVAPEKRLKIENLPELYMHQFWNTIKKIKDTDAYQFKLDKKKFRVDTKELGYFGKSDMLSAIHTDLMHHPWRTFAAIINSLQTYLDFATGKATPKKARKFRKVASPLMKLSPVLEEEPAKKPKRAKKPAKKSTTVPTTYVVIRDTPSVSVCKKKAPTKVDRGKGMDLLSEAALLEVVQLKKTLKKRKLENHKLHASGSGDGVGSQPKVPDESEYKRTGTDKGTGTNPRVPDVPKYQPKSENESWGDSDDDSHDDDSDDASNDDDDDDDSDAGGDNEASDSEKTDSDKDENPNLNQNEEEEEEYEEEYVRTPDSYGFTDEDEEYEELYKDVNVRLKDTEHEEGGKRDAKMTDDGRDDGTQHTTYEQVKDDEHVILTIVHNTQKTKVPLQSSSISSDFTNQSLILDNAPPIDNEVMYMMNIKVRHEEPSTQTPPLIPKTSSTAAPTIPPTIPSITPLPQQSTPTPTPTPTTEPTTTSIPALPDFSSLFEFNQRVSSQIPAMVDAQLSTKLEDSIQKAFRSYTTEFEKKAKDERKRYIDLVENYVKDIIKDKVKSQLPQILLITPKSRMDTLSLVSKYLNGMKNILDDGDYMEAMKLTVEKSKEELELFKELKHKSVIVNEGSHRVVVFKKSPPRSYSKPFTRFSLPYDVDGQGVWDAELDVTSVKEALDRKYKELKESKPVLEVLENYMTYRKKLNEVLMGRSRLSSDDYGEEEKMRIVEAIDIPVDKELPLLLGHPFLRTCGAVIDMGRDTLCIDDGVIRHTYFPKPRAKAYLDNFAQEEEEDD